MSLEPFISSKGELSKLTNYPFTDKKIYKVNKIIGL